ncbi:MAG: signal peptidase II [Pirellulales bacterium]
MPLSRYLLFFSLATVGCAVDLWTKSWIFARLGMPDADGRFIPVWDEILILQTNLNEGALFGMGQGYFGWFAVLSVLAGIGVLYWLFVLGAARDLILTVALGMISGGICGNLYDRLGLPGLVWNGIRGHEVGEPVYAVRDWVRFKIDSIGFDWPVFNVADSLLVCGAGLLLLGTFRRQASPSP